MLIQKKEEEEKQNKKKRFYNFHNQILNSTEKIVLLSDIPAFLNANVTQRNHPIPYTLCFVNAPDTLCI